MIINVKGVESIILSFIYLSIYLGVARYPFCILGTEGQKSKGAQEGREPTHSPA
jgi:hypothetical protein